MLLNETVSYDRAKKDGDVNQRDPRLIVDVKALECQTPRVLDDDPTEQIKNNADAAPDCAGDERFLKRRNRKINQIQVPED